MERLTERFSNGQAAVRGCGNNCKYDFKYCENHLEDCQTINEIYEKLAAYEDLEEQGRLIKIPCVFGDVVYVIPSKVTYKINVVNGKMDRNHVYKQVVSGVAPSKSGYVFYTCNNQNVLLEEEYKKTWFLTEQEANDALQKMNERED